MNSTPSPQPPAPNPQLLLAALDLALTAAACALWYLRPALGPWPLLLIAAGRLARTLALGRAGWRRNRFDPPLLLFGITAAAGACLAYNPAAGWGKFWVIVGGLALYDSLARGPQTARIAGRDVSPLRLLLAVLPAVIALYFLLTTDWPRWMGKLAWLDPLLAWLTGWQPDLPGHRLHPNVAGGLIAGLLPLQAIAIGRAKAGWPLLGLAAFCLLMTASRGAWLALAIGLAGWALARGAGRMGRTVNWLGIAAGVLLLAVAAAALATMPLAANLAETAMSRLPLLRNSLDLALDAPFTGLGLGGFQMAYSSYVLMLHVGHTFHSHNLLLDIWIEQGLMGLAAFAWLVVVSCQRSAVGGQRRGAALAALGVILVHGLVDDAFYGSRGVLLLFTPFAALAACGLQSPPGPPGLGGSAAGGGFPQLWGGRGGLRAGVALLVGALALVWALLPATRAAFQANLGALLQTRAELSVYRWPVYPLQDALRRQAPNAPPPADLSPAIARYRAALVLDPTNAAANRRLGQIELSQGDYASAAGHLAAAYRAAPNQQATRFLWGESEAIAGRVAEAAALWAGVGSPAWQAGAGRQAFELRAWWYGAIGEPENQRLVARAIRRLTTGH